MVNEQVLARFKDETRSGARKYAEALFRYKVSIVHDGFKPLSSVGKVALVCIAKNEDPYIEEWINYHLKLGVDHVFIYENDWRYGKERSNVTTIPFDGKARQIYAYNHFLYTQKEGFDWAVFIDVDEFICLKRHTNIKEFLREYGGIPSEVDALALNWMTFGDNGQTSTEGSLLERFTRCGDSPERHIKLIVNLHGDRIMTGPHNSYGFWIDTDGNIGNGNSNINAPVDVAQVNHYFCKTRPEFERKIARGRADFFLPKQMEDYDLYNKNDVEDLTALNFYRS